MVLGGPVPACWLERSGNHSGFEMSCNIYNITMGIDYNEAKERKRTRVGGSVPGNLGENSQ